MDERAITITLTPAEVRLLQDGMLSFILDKDDNDRVPTDEAHAKLIEEARALFNRLGVV
jgi:hypothetical protein